MKTLGLQENRVNGVAVTSLILGRIVYAVNWYSMAAVFSLVASELKYDVSGLAVVTAAFYVGIGVFQVPGGLLAAKIGPRLTVVCGTTVASLAALLTGFAGNLLEIMVLRFFVGVGMALVFAPAVILVTRFLREGSEGLGVGLYNSAFSLGRCYWIVRLGGARRRSWVANKSSCERVAWLGDLSFGVCMRAQ